MTRTSAEIPGYRYRPPDIPMGAIRRFARQLGERFHPDRIILFGSYAYGQPHPGSDVDLLVVMPVASEVNQSIRMSLAFEPPFPLDLIVRTPAKLKRRLSEGDTFLEQVVTQLVELGVAFPKTHRLEDLLLLLVAHDSSLENLRRTLVSLTRYTVDYRYPGESATKREATAALRQAQNVRGQLRLRLGLPH